MKKSLLFFTSVLFCAITFAQSVPQGINYQAVARDANGDELANQALSIQLSVIAASPTGTCLCPCTGPPDLGGHERFCIFV